MKRTHGFATRELRIAFHRLGHQSGAVLKGDDGVHFRIEPIDVVKIRRHHLDARHLPGMNGARKSDRIHHHDVGAKNRCSSRLRSGHRRRAHQGSSRQPEDGSTVQVGFVEIVIARGHVIPS
jgi:hypothetical protein